MSSQFICVHPPESAFICVPVRQAFEASEGKPLVVQFVGRRLVGAVPVLFLASLVVFAMLHLVPGDPIDSMMGAAAFQGGTVRADLVAQIRQELGLNDPLPVQYA